MSSSRSRPSRGTLTLPEPPAEAVVLDTSVASRSFRERLPPRLAARLVGRQPVLTFVTVGELARGSSCAAGARVIWRCPVAGWPTSR
jgi:hypothetical protein